MPSVGQSGHGVELSHDLGSGMHAAVPSDISGAPFCLEPEPSGTWGDDDRIRVGGDSGSLSPQGYVQFDENTVRIVTPAAYDLWTLSSDEETKVAALAVGATSEWFKWLDLTDVRPEGSLLSATDPEDTGSYYMYRLGVVTVQKVTVPTTGSHTSYCKVTDIYGGRGDLILRPGGGAAEKRMFGVEFTTSGSAAQLTITDTFLSQFSTPLYAGRIYVNDAAFDIPVQTFTIPTSGTLYVMLHAWYTGSSLACSLISATNWPSAYAQHAYQIVARGHYTGSAYVYSADPVAQQMIVMGTCPTTTP